MIEDTLANEVGSPVRGRLEVQEPEPGALAEPTTEQVFGLPPEPAPRPQAEPARTGRESPAVQLDTKFTFETFVAASSNRLAHAAAQAVAETPGRSYNPLFIYGDSGWARPTSSTPSATTSTENYPRRKVLYVTTETFMNDFVDSLRTSTTLCLQAALPRLRRPPHRRRAVHGAQRGPPGGVLPHLQRPQGRLQADRPDLGPAAQVDRDPRGPPAQPLPLRPHHRDRPPRPRDPPGHPPLQVAQRAPGRARRRPRVHRLPREGQHPGARGRADPDLRLRQPQQGAHLPGPGRAGPLRPRSWPASPAASRRR